MTKYFGPDNLRDVKVGSYVILPTAIYLIEKVEDRVASEEDATRYNANNNYRSGFTPASKGDIIDRLVTGKTVYRYPSYAPMSGRTDRSLVSWQIKAVIDKNYALRRLETLSQEVMALKTMLAEDKKEEKIDTTVSPPNV